MHAQVVHGTDTMSYTASALSLLLQGFKRPVVMTGSQMPLSAPRSDARSNLLGEGYSQLGSRAQHVVCGCKSVKC